MKVKTLIEKLSKLDPELPIMVDAYEGGINQLKDISIVSYEINTWHDTDPELFGRFDVLFRNESDPKCVLLSTRFVD